MATTSKIEWTEMTWNPVTGCVKVSQGCKHCYAERMAKRLFAMGAERYENAFRPTLHDDLIDLPRKWKKPRVIFVNSMSDLFQEAVPEEFIRRVFMTMRECPQHTFQILTKRSERLRDIGQRLQWPFNVWMGVSVENAGAMGRITDLAAVPAHIRFLSCEPLIGPLDDLQLKGIHWVIVGGESGPGARPMEPGWVEGIHRQCRRERVPFFFKQWGGVRKDRTGRSLNGRTYDEMPQRLSTFNAQLCKAG
ncbi:MAG: phage Gp37/Gp68 family protein [Acidobacteriia bacterium]|nr:phage Gp37/Gp68 family protein [Terriglobia bacterium]